MKRLALALSLTLLAAGPGLAQPDPDAPRADDPPADAPPEGTPKREGEYGGVDPTSPDAAPAKGDKGKRGKAPAKRTLTWIGFAPKEDGASELFFQAAQPFQVQQRIEGRTLVVLLEGLPKQARNTRRPLDMRFFETALLRVTAKPVRAVRARKGKPGHPAGIEVRIAFKDPKDAREGALRVETGKDGLAYAYLGFGPPSGPRREADGPSGGTLSDPE